MSGSYKTSGGGAGDLMAFLEAQRSLFASEEEFRAFAMDQVRQFVIDLRRLDIEVSLRPTWQDRSPTNSSPSIMGN